jgi:hypothetical protein
VQSFNSHDPQSKKNLKKNYSDGSPPNTTTFMGGQQGVCFALPTFGHSVTCTKGDKGLRLLRSYVSWEDFVSNDERMNARSMRVVLTFYAPNQM